MVFKCIKRISVIFIMLALSQESYAQKNIQQAENRELLPKFCTELIHRTVADFSFENPGLAVIHFGDFANDQNLQTILSLDELQVENKNIRFLIIARNRNNGPQPDYKTLYNLATPVYYFDQSQIASCTGGFFHSATFLINNHGEIVENISPFADKENILFKIKETIRKSESFKNGEYIFTGVSPHSYGKSYLMECPSGIATDAENERIFVSDYCGNRILVISIYGEILEVIGSGRPGNKNGNIHEASFHNPRGLAWEEKNQKLYIADSKNRAVKVVDFLDQTVSQLPVDSLPTINKLSLHNGNLYISTAHNVFKYNLFNHTTEKLNSETVYGPTQLVLNDRDELLFAEKETPTIVKLGNKEPTRTFFKIKKDKVAPKNFMSLGAAGMAAYGNKLIIVDNNHFVIRLVNGALKKSKIIAGNYKSGYKNGTGKKASFTNPSDVGIIGNIAYIADAGNGVIRKMDLTTNQVSTLQLIDYLKLSYQYAPPIFDLRTSDTLFVAEGKNTVSIHLDFEGGYELDTLGFSYVSITSRNRSLKVRENILTKKTPLFEIEIGPDKPVSDVLIDFYLFFNDKSEPGKIYKQAFTMDLIMALKEKKETTNSHEFKISFNPDEKLKF